MFGIVFLSAIIATAANANDLPNLGIIGGSSATPGQFPYQISIEYNGQQSCGGTIIGPKTVLTAAHCVHRIPSSVLKVLAGTHNRLVGGQRVGIAKYVVHENYAPPATGYDIAIITLDKELTYSSTIKAADLPEEGEVLYNNAVATVSGWGTEYHKGPTTYALKFVTIPLWSRDRCVQFVPDLPTTHLCAGDSFGQQNSCPGDSGGPLSIGNKIIGIVSFGFGCGAPHRPAAYTYVGGLRGWIRQKANI